MTTSFYTQELAQDPFYNSLLPYCLKKNLIVLDRNAPDQPLQYVVVSSQDFETTNRLCLEIYSQSTTYPEVRLLAEYFNGIFENSTLSLFWFSLSEKALSCFLAPMALQYLDAYAQLKKAKEIKGTIQYRHVEPQAQKILELFQNDHYHLEAGGNWDYFVQKYLNPNPTTLTIQP